MVFSLGLSKAETQALCNYGSGEDENEVEEIEEFEAGPVEVQTSLQACMDNSSEHRQVCWHAHERANNPTQKTLIMTCCVVSVLCLTKRSPPGNRIRPRKP